MSAWSVPAEPEVSWDGVEAWIEEYCRTADCGPSLGPGLEDGVRLCNGRWECRPGLLVPFASDVQAFFTDGDDPSRMVVVAVWRPDRDHSVAPYGGSIRLLEGFLSTMDVCPARLDQTPWGCPESVPAPSG